jgi:hypothetical protein
MANRVFAAFLFFVVLAFAGKWSELRAQDNQNKADNLGGCVVMVQGSNNIIINTANCKALSSQSAPGPQQAPETDSSIKFKVTNSTPSRQMLKFYGPSTRHIWPALDRHFDITSGLPFDIDLACSSGEKVCFGLSYENNAQSWGVGFRGNLGCSNCCYICPSAPGANSISLNFVLN